MPSYDSDGVLSTLVSGHFLSFRPGLDNQLISIACGSLYSLAVSRCYPPFNSVCRDQGRVQPGTAETFEHMKLSAARVKIETKPGRLNDGNGLYLLIRPDGRKGWIFRYRLGDKQRDMGLGSYPEVSLAEARQHATQARQRLRSGADPIQTRRGERAALAQGLADASERTFEALAEQYIARHEATWKNDKHRAQWKSSLARYAYPKIGDRDVATIDRAGVLEVLEPIWNRAPETASRVRGRIEIVLD